MGRSHRMLNPLSPDTLATEVRRRFGDFIAQRIDPGTVERDRMATPLTREMLQEAGRLGLMGFNVPESIGGQGRSWAEWGYVLHEIGYLSEDAALPMLLAYCGTLTKLLYESGREDLIDRYARPMAQGKRIGGFGWSEGRDAFSFITTLRRTGSDYVLNGQKIPIANALIADTFMIFARSEETSDVVAVLVERDDPGVEVVPFSAMGLRASGMGRVLFKDVRLPPERVLVEADGLSYGQRFLNERRLEMPCWALGRMRRLFELCVHELANRVRFKLPLTEMQTIQAAIGRMYVGVETSRIVVKSVLERVATEEYDALWDPPLALTKSHVIEQALQMCRTVQDILGGAGVFEDYPFERHIRDLTCLNPIAGTLATLQVDLGILSAAEVERAYRHQS